MSLWQQICLALEQERDGKENALEAEIQALEHGEFNYYVPQTYINNIKEWI